MKIEVMQIPSSNAYKENIHSMRDLPYLPLYSQLNWVMYKQTKGHIVITVSYTHLTLPTIYSV